MVQGLLGELPVLFWVLGASREVFRLVLQWFDMAFCIGGVCFFHFLSTWGNIYHPHTYVDAWERHVKTNLDPS
jgi:hypothetical protein